jgi:hypothetical protein
VYRSKRSNVSPAEAVAFFLLFLFRELLFSVELLLFSVELNLYVPGLQEGTLPEFGLFSAGFGTPIIDVNCALYLIALLYDFI